MLRRDGEEGDMVSRVVGELEGVRVAFTGRLACMTRPQLQELLETAGATYHDGLQEDTSVLVVGQEGWPLRRDGRLTRDLSEANRRQEAGDRVLEILAEEEFLTRVGLAGGSSRLYTTEQLGRILQVPSSEIRSWVRLGIVKPARAVGRLCTFDFAQVASAKALVGLRKSGVSVVRISASLRQLGRWWPGASKSLTQLGLMEDGGRVVVELDDGRKVEPDGQLQLDFTSPVPAGPTLRPTVSTSNASTLPGVAERWFEDAVRHEESGEFEESARAYHRALCAGEARAEICFNLGNVLYALARTDGAAQRFMQAVELEPDYVEAWNNLGNVLCELGEWDDAVEVYQRALDLEPDYPDGHFNFGECLHQLGEWERAREHWNAYLRLDPDSAWANRVKTLLRETEKGSPR